MGKFDSNTAKEAGKKSKRGVSEKVRFWNELKDYITEKGADKFKAELMKLSGKDFINTYVSVLEFFKPKLQRSQVESKNETVIFNETKTYEADGKTN